VPFWISLGILLNPVLPSSWLHISSATRSIFCVVQRESPFVHYRPFKKLSSFFSILHRRSWTELTAQFLFGNFLQMPLAPIPFVGERVWLALYLYVKWRYIVFPIVFPVELGCFHLFYPITKLLKIFARNVHMLLRIDYISTCVIHFKCTLLLEDIISWHV